MSASEIALRHYREILGMDGPLPDWLYSRWQKFLENDKARERGLDIYEEVFASDIFPLQRKRELTQMMRIARTRSPETVYEIGCDKGGGLYHWCKSLLTVRRVIACEIRGLPYRELFEKAFPQIEFIWLPASSYAHDSLRIVRQFLSGRTIDCLFIDGDKSAFHTDFYSSLPFMSRKSIVFMHDIQDESPGAAYETVTRQTGYLHKEIIDTSEVGELAGKGTENATAYENWLQHWGGRSCGVGVIYIGSSGPSFGGKE